MNGYIILKNRKRSLIALIHSVVFALIALRSIASSVSVNPIWLNTSLIPAIAILTVYVAVSSILVQLATISRLAIERIYFGFCASSATLGLLRTIVGDRNLPAGQYLRFLMLLCAVTTGIVIVRSHSRSMPAVESGMS